MSGLEQPLNNPPVVVSVNINGNEPTENNVETELKSYEEKINYDIGYYWWKRYVAGAIWNNISTPISLAITIITALTTGQAATKDLINETTNVRLGMAALIISTLNTFFRPAQQLMENMEKMKLWAKMGTDFEKVYYDRVHTIEEKRKKLSKYQELFNQVNELKRESATNFFTDMVYLVARNCCMTNGVEWIQDDDNCHCLGGKPSCCHQEKQD